MVFVFLLDLPSLTMIISSIHVAANGIFTFFLKNGWVVFPLYIWPHLYPFTLLWTSCFHVLAIVDSAAMNTRVHILSNYSFLQLHALEWDCRIIWQFHFHLFWGRTSILSSVAAAPIYIPTYSVGGFLFLHTLPSIVCRFFWRWPFWLV